MKGVNSVFAKIIKIILKIINKFLLHLQDNDGILYLNLSEFIYNQFNLLDENSESQKINVRSYCEQIKN